MSPQLCTSKYAKLDNLILSPKYGPYTQQATLSLLFGALLKSSSLLLLPSKEDLLVAWSHYFTLNVSGLFLKRKERILVTIWY